MLTFPQIIRKTSKLRKLNATYVKLTRLKVGYNRKGQAFIAAQSYSTHVFDPKKLKPVKSLNRTRYVTSVTFLNNKLQVRCSCSCPDFTYRAEYALSKRGAAEIEYSNGEAPVTTNPGLVPMCCKHLVAVYEHIKEKLPA